ncbi:CopD family protein [Mesorhizobium sp. CAU 1741]|uniref:copper resistance CopC/CopD family protein n=1 Tax=Mesorhizobium sp. CAU 1741 TaxID=3140366 RepID=UPI00325C0640
MRLVKCLLLALLFWPATIGAAAAHASLTSSKPADGVVMKDAPSGFSLSFSEPVSPLALSLIRPDGTTIPLEQPGARGNLLEMDAPAALTEGTHVLTWRVVSLDGHPVAGSVVFSIGEPSAAPPAVSEPYDTHVRLGLWLSRIALYIGVFVGLGGAVAVTWLHASSRSGQHVVASALAIGFVGTALSPGFQGLDALGATLARYTDPTIWSTGLQTSYGWTVIVVLVALFASGLSLATRSIVLSRLLSAGGLALGATALALSGHASAAEPQWLTRPAVFLHTATIGLWIGALAPLGVALWRGTEDAASALRAFSRFIPVAVAILIAAGLALTIIQVQQPSALWRTDYGRLLLAKLALVIALFALACINRWRLTLPAEAGEATARRRLARMIAAETAIALLIFGIAAGWRFTPPPRALAIAAAQPESIHIHTEDAMADVTVTPGRAGPVSVSAVIMTGEFGPLDAKELTFVFSNPAAGIEPFRREAQKPGDGSWRTDDVVLPVAGVWTLRLDILVTDFDLVRIEGDVSIRP